jgi:hypothetical protein
MHSRIDLDNNFREVISSSGGLPNYINDTNRQSIGSVAVLSKIATAELPDVVLPAFCTNVALLPMAEMPTPATTVVPEHSYLEQRIRIISDHSKNLRARLDSLTCWIVLLLLDLTS